MGFKMKDELKKIATFNEQIEWLETEVDDHLKRLPSFMIDSWKEVRHYFKLIGYVTDNLKCKCLSVKDLEVKRAIGAKDNA